MKIPDNLVFVLFGASGDLAFRKIIPAIYSLKIHLLLPENLKSLVLADQLCQI